MHTNGGPDGGAHVFDDSSTLPVWLHAVGYRTGIFGKYLNGYAALAPYQAPGWDEWHVFRSPGYFNYHLIENGVDVVYGSAATDYSTDVLRDEVVRFIAQSTPPFFVEMMSSGLFPTTLAGIVPTTLCAGISMTETSPLRVLAR